MADNKLDQVGISTKYFPDWGVYRSVKAASDMGFELVEFSGDHKHEPNWAKSLERVKKDFVEITFTIHGYFPPSFKGRYWFDVGDGLSDKNRTILENMYIATTILNPPIVSFHPTLLRGLEYRKLKGRHKLIKGKNPRKREVALDNSYRFFDYLLKKFKHINTKFAIENSEYGDLPIPGRVEEFKEFFKRFPQFGFIYDIGHDLNYPEQYTFLELADKAVELHVHDTIRTKDKVLEEHVLVGEGCLNITKTIGNPRLQHLPWIVEHTSKYSRDDIVTEKGVLECFKSAELEQRL